MGHVKWDTCVAAISVQLALVQRISKERYKDRQLLTKNMYIIGLFFSIIPMSKLPYLVRELETGSTIAEPYTFLKVNLFC